MTTITTRSGKGAPLTNAELDANFTSLRDNKLEVGSTTSDIAEGTRQYFTQARARAALSATGSLSYDNATGIFSFTQGNTDTVSEGATNLYFTNARARSAISVTGSATYNPTTGVINVTGGVSSVNTKTGAVTLTTSDISEGANLYYTDARARAAISATGSLSYNNTTGVMSFTQGNTDTVAEGSTNLYYTNTRARNAISGNSGISYNATTGVISCTITQYTDALARASISASGSLSYNSSTGVISYTTPSTSGISEGTNLYYTDARARAAISAGTGISYNSSTGVVSSTITQYTDALARAAISGTAPVSYNSTTGAISMSAATASVNGYMTSTYASKLDGIAAGATNVTNTNQLTNGAGFITGSGNTTGSSGSIAVSGGWSVTPSGTKLYFAYNGVNKGSLDSSGNFIVVGNVTAYGTP